MKARTPRSTTDYLDAAVSARARFGIGVLADELGLTTEHAKALIWAHYEATGDDTPYADCLRRGEVVLATLSELSLNRVESWIRDGFEFGAHVGCPMELRRVLDSLHGSPR
jgi:hypothetical protein